MYPLFQGHPAVAQESQNEPVCSPEVFSTASLLNSCINKALCLAGLSPVSGHPGSPYGLSFVPPALRLSREHLLCFLSTSLSHPQYSYQRS